MCSVPCMVPLRMHQPYLNEPWRLDDCRPIFHDVHAIHRYSFFSVQPLQAWRHAREALPDAQQYLRASLYSAPHPTLRCCTALHSHPHASFIL